MQKIFKQAFPRAGRTAAPTKHSMRCDYGEIADPEQAPPGKTLTHRSLA
jgi:hypothetical protein